MEQQNHSQTNKRITFLIAVAGVAMLVGLAGLVIALMRPTPPSSSQEGSAQPDSSSQIIDGPTFTPGDGDAPKKGNASNN